MKGISAFRKLKLKNLLTVSLSKKDAQNNRIDIRKNASETADLFTEMSEITSSENPPQKIITYDLLMNADFYRYAGKGLIQATWKVNYKEIVTKIKIDIPGFTVDLVNEPEKIMIADNAIYALVLGLKHGAYGHPLSDYLEEGVISTNTDWENARYCVNKQERAEMFARCASIYADLVFRLQA